VKERPRTFGRIAQPIKTIAQRFAYVSLVGAAFGLMLLGKADVVLVERLRISVTDAFAPILAAVSQPVASVSRMIGEAEDLLRVREENTALRQDRTRLVQWQAIARKLEAENRALRAMLNFVPGPAVSFVTARVIADAGGAFAHSLVVNAGEREGVKKGSAVVTGDGLIGRIAGLGDRSSRILLLTDLNSRIPVVIEKTRIRAIMAGDNSGRPKLIYLPSGAAVTVGERVVTSGNGGAFPPGIPVGTVAAVGESGISVQPFIKRDRLEYVRIVDFRLDRGLTIGGAGSKSP
jgi:rod shape-determining protein MreC